MKQGGNGEDGDGRAISDVKAGKAFEVKPSNAKDPVSFAAGKLSGGTDKDKGSVDEAWRSKAYWSKRGSA